MQSVTEALSPGVKGQLREADHSPSTVAKGKNDWSYASDPPYAIIAR
jgi:hypothetical protein